MDETSAEPPANSAVTQGMPSGHMSPATRAVPARPDSTPRARKGDNKLLIDAIRREVDTAEERIGKRLSQLEAQFHGFCEDTIAKVQERMQDADAWQPEVARQLAELTGGLAGVRGELPRLLARMDRSEEACRACQRRTDACEQKVEGLPKSDSGGNQEAYVQLESKVRTLELTVSDAQACKKICDEMLEESKRLTLDMEQKFQSQDPQREDTLQALEAQLRAESTSLGARLKALETKAQGSSTEELDLRLRQAEEQLLALAKAVACPAAPGMASAELAEQQAQLERGVRAANDLADRAMESVKAMATKLMQTLPRANLEDRLGALEGVVSDHDDYIQSQLSLLDGRGLQHDGARPDNRDMFDGLWRDVGSQQKQLQDVSCGLDELRSLLNKDLDDLRLGLNEVQKEVSSRAGSKEVADEGAADGADDGAHGGDGTESAKLSNIGLQQENPQASPSSTGRTSSRFAGRSYQSASDILSKAVIQDETEGSQSAPVQTYRAALEGLDEAWQASGLAAEAALHSQEGAHPNDVVIADASLQSKDAQVATTTWSSLIRGCFLGLAAKPKPQPNSSRPPVTAHF
mmetsp:Transcript_6534/g.15993  ORF Transcript_6534/g.15993 Transcript_6534/m.15993 type:complete len:579 (-) Transcript_6534:25-1761(-)